MSLVISICVLFYVGFMALLISGLFKHTELEIKSYETLPSVSVVVAARNEEGHIPYLINDLISQEYPLDKLEVIIVNDRSTDDTKAILDDASDNYAFIKVVTINQVSKDMTPKKYALTRGIEAAVGEIIVLTDADCRVRKLWVSSMAYSVISKESISIGFSEINPQHESFFHRYQKIDFLSIVIANAGFSGWGLFWSGTGQNLAFFKRDFEKIEGFETQDFAKGTSSAKQYTLSFFRLSLHSHLSHFVVFFLNIFVRYFCCHHINRPYCISIPNPVSKCFVL